jgi:hypothetical protein
MQGVLLHIRTVIQGVFTVNAINLDVEHGNEYADPARVSPAGRSATTWPAAAQRDVDRVDR